MDWLSLGKLRLNYAEVGNSAPWGSTSDIYFKPAAFGSTTLFSLPDTKNNNELEPERTKSYEAGLEAAFLKNRVGFDLTYYSTEVLIKSFLLQYRRHRLHKQICKCRHYRK